MKFINKKIVFIAIFCWVLIITGNFWWIYRTRVMFQKQLAKNTINILFDMLIRVGELDREFNGLFVLVKNKHNIFKDSNFYIHNKETSNMFVKISPSYLIKKISEIIHKHKNIRFHLTSLDPINPENKPNELEKKVLYNFYNHNVNEEGMFIKHNGKNIYFYMKALRLKKSCFRCHVERRYKEGCIRGGISVYLPVNNSQLVLTNLLMPYIGLCVIGVLVIGYGGNKLINIYTQLEKSSFTDSLTQLPNRRSFNEVIQREFSNSQRNKTPLSVIMCDIDKFKLYNDTYGHQAGDVCLAKVAMVIKKSLNRPSDYCARYGGEEFIVVLSTSFSGSLHVAERIRKNVEEMQIPHKKWFYKVVTISVGVASMEDTSGLTSYEEILKKADEALYMAKTRGRNQVQMIELKSQT
ncbi:MAG: diguanylate cyclase [Desulfonauticus sp.]|nr:diguanylate cyclase [Desulfonauticus sp.]